MIRISLFFMFLLILTGCVSSLRDQKQPDVTKYSHEDRMRFDPEYKRKYVLQEYGFTEEEYTPWENIGIRLDYAEVFKENNVSVEDIKNLKEFMREKRLFESMPDIVRWIMNGYTTNDIMDCYNNLDLTKLYQKKIDK